MIKLDVGSKARNILVANLDSGEDRIWPTLLKTRVIGVQLLISISLLILFEKH